MCAGWPSMMASQRKTYLAAAALWSGSRAVPRSLHGGQMATYPAPAAARVKNSRRFQRIMPWEAMRWVQDSGWGIGITCVRALIHFRGFWWGSEPQMLLVQQPEWLSDGCKAMEAEAGGNGTMSHCRLPGHLNYSAASPLVWPCCKN